MPTGCVFSEPAFVNLRTCPARPIRAHTCSAITRRLCGWLGASGTQDLRALRLWQSSRQWRAQPWSWMQDGCCARVSLAEALLSQQIDGVTRAGSAGTKSGSSARSLRTARLRDQLGLDDEANSSGPCHLRRRFANFQRQRGPAGPSESVFCADGPFTVPLDRWCFPHTLTPGSEREFRICVITHA
jgi:hypothetical protein